MFATIFWGNRKFCSLPSTFKAEARFRVKTKVFPEVTNSEQFLPHISGAAEYIFFPWPWNLTECCSSVTNVQVLVLTHNFEMRRPNVVRLTVCRVLVLTHNFLIRKQVITRLQMKMFVGCVYLEGKWKLWVKTSRGGSFDSKPTLLCLQLYSEVTGNFVCCLLLSKLKLGLELKRKLKYGVTDIIFSSSP